MTHHNNAEQVRLAEAEKDALVLASMSRHVSVVSAVEQILTARLNRIQQIFDMQCPPMTTDAYVDPGAHMAHTWWNTVLGAEIARQRKAAGNVPDRTSAYAPDHCPTCQCEPVGPLPHHMPVDPYCPEHGSRPTAYSDCSCRRRAELSTPPASPTPDAAA